MRWLLLACGLAALSAATVTDFAGGVREVADLSAVDLADLDTVVWGGGPAPRVDPARGLWLNDGSWLPLTALVAAGADRLRATTPLGELELPLDVVLGWGAELPAASREQDVALLEGGLVEGRLLGIADGALRLQTRLDPEPLVVPLAAVRALRLALPRRAPSGLHLVARLHPERPPLLLVPAGGGLALAAWPAAALRAEALGALALRVEGGRRVYLSQLPPETVEERGAFGVVWPYQRDRGLHGGPLRLMGVAYERGLAVHSAARLAWRLDGAYRQLRAMVGISDEVAPEGDCLVHLEGDGRRLWSARLIGGEAPRRLELDLAGVQRLTLMVELGERFDIGDHALLADAQLIRR